MRIVHHLANIDKKSGSLAVVVKLGDVTILIYNGCKNYNSVMHDFHLRGNCCIFILVEVIFFYALPQTPVNIYHSL